MLLIYLVIAPILVGVLLYFFHFKKATRILAILAQIGIFIGSIFLFIEARELTELYPIGRAFGMEGVTYNIGGFYYGMGIILVSDVLSAVFIMLTAFMFLLAIFYSFNENNTSLYWFLLFLWQGVLMGVFLSGDFFNIFVLLEVGTLVVTILILFSRKNRSLYDGLIYFMVNVVSMQFYLLGVGYIYRYTGTLNIYYANAQFANTGREYLMLPYALIMTFIVLKSALVPLYSWLPKAHGTKGAPSAVSALLSGLHIKSSVYLFLRFQYTFEIVALTEFFMVLGIITAIFGFVMALGQKDLKLILAYHTISQIGLIFTGLNMGITYSYMGALYHMMNHALFKSTLFLSGGIIAYAYGTRNVYEIRGVLKKMPVVGVATMLAVFGITGTPIFNGSISKYFISSETYGLMNWILIFMSLGTIVSFIKFSTILFGEPKKEIGEKKVDILQQIPIIVLGSLCFLGGIFGRQFIDILFNVQLTIDPAGYFEKSLIFFASLVVGYLLFKYYVKDSKLIKTAGAMELGFRSIIMAIGLFFATILLFVGFS
ncbi:MAG: proton-conducting membrane transporter [Defluviitaleaceae bacterium]|nr:proton-conducting membrane transporter [Defluviitaleaceae bacterium]